MIKKFIKLLFLSAFLFGWAAEADSQFPLKVRSARKAVWKLSYTNGFFFKDKGWGTVFFIGPKLLVTNFHIIDNLENIKNARLSQEGNSREISLKRIIALSALHDLVLIETKGAVRDYLSLKEKFSDIKELYVLGYPRGEDFMEIKKTGPVHFRSDLFSFTVNYSSLGGTSGAPVLNKEGKLLGVVSQGKVNLLKAIALEPLRHFVQGDIGLRCATESLKDCLKKEAENLKKLAKQSHAVAQYILSTFYIRGGLVRKDNLKAIKWMKLAAKQGYAPAQYFLYWFDLRFPTQPIGKTREFSNKTSITWMYNDIFKAKAIKWLKLAAEKDYFPAQMAL